MTDIRITDIPKRNSLRLKKKSFLRKCSDDFNDFYVTKKLFSNYFDIAESSSLSVKNEMILTSNSNSLNFYNYNDGKVKLAHLQKISLPGDSNCLSSILLSSTSAHDEISALSAHSNGTVNLISTNLSTGNASIVRRYNHRKYLTSANPNATLSKTTPVKKLLNFGNDSFISVINESMFIYHLENKKAPLFLQSFSGLESLSYNENISSNRNLVALSGSQFGSSGISLLDLLSNKSNQYSPSSSSSQNVISYDCLWLDEYRVANTINNTVKIWDVRSNKNEAICEILTNKGYVHSLSYDTNSKTLYTNDDQNIVISWDLTNLAQMDKATLSQGFDSVISDLIPQNKNFNERVYQCGNIIINGTRLKSSSRIHTNYEVQTYGTNGILTVQNNELGVHQIKNVQYPIMIPQNEEVEEKSYSDSTLINDTKIYDTKLHDTQSMNNYMIDKNENSPFQTQNHSRTTLIGEEIETNNNDQELHHHHSNSMYSISEMLLSGSTIYA